MSTLYTSANVSAPGIFFDNSTNSFASTNVQAAIEEAKAYVDGSEVNATSAATAGTGADALMTGMTATPTVGTYLVWFSCDLNSATSGVVVSVSIYVGGVQKADSLRKVMPFAGGTLTAGSQRACISTNGLVTVNGSQAIEIRWSASAGAPTTAARTLNYLRVS